MSIPRWCPGLTTQPSLDASVLEAYQPKPPTGGYTIDDHPHLAHGPMREVFEAFRKQVLALDPCVSGEFLKLYVAYKAETNFVDVVPQAAVAPVAACGFPRDRRSAEHLQRRFGPRSVGQRRC
jgi:hypothetical protein